MRLLYFFDDHVKPHLMRGKGYCNPAPTGPVGSGVVAVREGDVNFWLYSRGDDVVAFDTGHLNFPGVDGELARAGCDPARVRHVFLTHADVDHAGGIDACGTSIFPNAQVYLGRKEEAYLTGETHRMVKAGVRLKNCVRLAPGYRLLDDGEHVRVGDVDVEAVHIPGHTLGHLCYIVDGKVLISGDCLAVNGQGGWSFPDFFTQYPDMNKESLKRLERIVRERGGIELVCTGHSGARRDMDALFAHASESATFSRAHPFDADAPVDFRKA